MKFHHFYFYFYYKVKLSPKFNVTLMHVINDEEVNIWGKKQLLGTNKRMDQSRMESKIQ